MRDFRLTRSLLLIVTMLALALVQVLGGVRGYLCDCGDAAEVVAAAHCHGPHGENCHAASAHAMPGNCASDSDAHQHAVITTDPPAASAGASQITLHPPVLISLPPIFEGIAAPLTRRARGVEMRGSPPAVAALARSVQFLI